MKKTILLCLFLLAFSACSSEADRKAAQQTPGDPIQNDSASLAQASKRNEGFVMPNQDAVTFICADMQADTIISSNSEYLGLDASKGLDVIVWQLAPESYSFGLLEHADEPRDRLSAELLELRGIDAAQMREILASYSLSEDEITIIPWQKPISSYLPDYCVNYGGEDMDAKKKAYVDQIREMLFG